MYKLSILVLMLLLKLACPTKNFNEITCNCQPKKLMEGEIIEVSLNKNIFKNLLIEKPNKQFIYIQNKSIDSLYMPQKQFVKTNTFKLNTQTLTDYIYFKNRKLKSRVFDRDGNYKIIFTNANKVEDLKENEKKCEVWFAMWK